MLIDKLTTLVVPEIDHLGFVLWGIEINNSRLEKKGMTLRIFIDHPQGISVDDCQEVSHVLSAMLDVENPIDGDYDLEISSPGLNRRIFNPEQAKMFSGHEVKVELSQAIVGNRRRFKGVVTSVENANVSVKTQEGDDIVFNFKSVDMMRVVPKFE